MEEHSNLFKSREDLYNVEKNILTENSEISKIKYNAKIHQFKEF